LVQPKNLSDRKIDRINTDDPRVKDLLNDVKPADNMKDFSQGIRQYTLTKSLSQKDIMFKRSEGMLVDFCNRFDVASTVRAKDLGLSASASDKIFKFIEQEQLAEKFSLNLTGGRGKTSKFYTLTTKGYDVISRTPPKQSGGTGVVHFFLCRYLKKYLPQKGFSDLVIEKNIGGKQIDVFGVYETLKIGIEICCSTLKTEHLNFSKDKDYCDLVIITTPDKKTKIKLERELYKKIEPSKKLKTCIVHELLNQPEKIILN